MDVGLSIIMRKEEDSKYKVFSFLRPFDFNLWLAIVSTTLGVGVFLWLHSTFSPYGYHGRVAQARDKKTVTTDQIKAKDHLRFFNAIWSSFAYYVSQGPDVLHPISLSGRIAVGVWWFAVLIIGKKMTGSLRVKLTKPGLFRWINNHPEDSVVCLIALIYLIVIYLVNNVIHLWSHLRQILDVT